MTYYSIETRWRYFMQSEIGVCSDHAVLQFKYREQGWCSVLTCHASTIPLLKRDGVRAHLELLRVKK